MTQHSRSSRKLSIILSLTVALLFTVIPRSPAHHDVLVVVASRHTPVNYLSRHQVQQLYFGKTGDRFQPSMRAIINESDSRLKQVFLQKVMFMSERAYDHYVKNMRKRQPPDRKKHILLRCHTLEQLGQQLAGHPERVSFIWARQLTQLRGRVKILLSLPRGHSW